MVKTRDKFSLSKLQKKIKWYVEKGINRGLKGEELHKYAISKADNWIDMFYPEQTHLKSQDA